MRDDGIAARIRAATAASQRLRCQRFFKRHTVFLSVFVYAGRSAFRFPGAQRSSHLIYSGEQHGQESEEGEEGEDRKERGEEDRQEDQEGRQEEEVTSDKFCPPAFLPVTLREADRQFALS